MELKEKIYNWFKDVFFIGLFIIAFGSAVTSIIALVYSVIELFTTPSYTVLWHIVLAFFVLLIGLKIVKDILKHH